MIGTAQKSIASPCTPFVPLSPDTDAPSRQALIVRVDAKNSDQNAKKTKRKAEMTYVMITFFDDYPIACIRKATDNFRLSEAITDKRCSKVFFDLPPNAQPLNSVVSSIKVAIAKEKLTLLTKEICSVTVTKRSVDIATVFGCEPHYLEFAT